jgi:uncharacterized protein (TIGR02145 family)
VRKLGIKNYKLYKTTITMKKKVLVLLSLALVLSVNLHSQVTIGGLTTPKAGALLDLNSTTPGGLVLSNVNLDDLSVIPANTFVGISTQQDTNQELAGMIVYNTYAANGVGVYVWDGDDWIKPCAPPAPGAITFSETKVCGSGATFTAKIDSVKGATSYVWELPAGLTGTSNDTIITISGAVGTYLAGSITVRAVSSCGGGTRRASTQEVTLLGAIPAAPTGGSVTNMNGNSFEFSASVPSDCTIDWYDAAIGGNPVGTGTPFSKTLSGTTTYYAESRNTATDCVSATRLNVRAEFVPRTVSDCDVILSYPDSVITNSANVRFTNDDTYTRNNRTFSAPVKIVGRAARSAFASSNTTLVDYRDHTSDANTNYYGSWFTWCMVVTHADILCPSPWRVPTSEDFCQYANGSTANTNANYSITNGVDGWLVGGNATGSSTNRVGSIGYYWSSTPFDTDRSYQVYLRSGYFNDFSPNAVGLRSEGNSLRCVQTAP